MSASSDSSASSSSSDLTLAIFFKDGGNYEEDIRNQFPGKSVKYGKGRTRKAYAFVNGFSCSEEFEKALKVKLEGNPKVEKAKPKRKKDAKSASDPASASASAPAPAPAPASASAPRFDPMTGKPLTPTRQPLTPDEYVDDFGWNYIISGELTSDMSAPSGLPPSDPSIGMSSAIVPVSEGGELDVFGAAMRSELESQRMMAAIANRVSMHGQVLVNHEDRLGEIERRMNIGPRMNLNPEF